MLALDRRTAQYTWTVAFLLLVATLIYLIRDTIFLFAVALLFAYLLWPVVQLLDRWLPGRSRLLALVLVYVLLVGVLIIVGVAVGSRVAEEANALAAKLPDLLTKHPVAESVGPAAHANLRSTILATIQQQVASHSRELLALLPGAALHVIASAQNLLFIVLVPILSFFILKDGREISAALLDLLGEGATRARVEAVAGDLHLLLAQYMRALVLLGLVAALAYGLFFTILRIPYAFLLAAVAFPLEFIPMVGPITGAVIVLLVAGVGGSGHLLTIILFLAAFRVFQDYFVSPRLLSTGMNLHPLLVIFGVLAGASIAGVAGSFLSVPVLAALRILVRQLLAKPPRADVVVDSVPNP